MTTTTVVDVEGLRDVEVVAWLEEALALVDELNVVLVALDSEEVELGAASDVVVGEDVESAELVVRVVVVVGVDVGVSEDVVVVVGVVVEVGLVVVVGVSSSDVVVVAVVPSPPAVAVGAGSVEPVPAAESSCLLIISSLSLPMRFASILKA